MEDERFGNTEFICEASSFEKLALWRERDGIEWIQDNEGKMVMIGSLDNRVISISVSWTLIDGLRVMFWEATSKAVDYAQIEDWFDINCDPRWDSGSRLARTNAMNFHHVLGAAKEKRKNKNKRNLINPNQCGSGKAIARNYPDDYFG